VSKSNFRDLFNFCDNTVVHDKNRKIKKKDLITFLIKLKYDLSDDLKVLLSYNSRVSVSLAIPSVRTSLSQRFVLENLGPASIFLLHFANQLYNPDPENRRAIIYVDGTYLKIPKSSNFRSLPQSYCLHKGYHLLKPALVVAPEGYILDVDGPYFSDSRNNDAAMLQDHLENQELQDANQLRQWLEEDDIKIVNRGYRDATNLLGYLGLECKIPPLLLRGQRQYSTEEANTARLITKTRWIVEARNGHIKLLFKFFRGQIPIHHVPHIGSYFRIACAIINRYFPPIEMQGATAELADSMRELAEHKNVVKARVEIDRLHLQRMPSISTDDILRHLLKLKPSSASGDDALPGFILKDCAQILVTPLHFLYNLILTTSVYPCLWKVGKICPIFKSGKKNIISNYRPVTILPHISKVFESIIYSYIYILMYKMLSLNISMDFLGVGLRPPIYLASRILFQLRWIKILRLMSSTPTFQKHLIASIITSY
jgi:hypothetical protein